MALRYEEFFGYAPGDPKGQKWAQQRRCPFTKNNCIKPSHGSCSLSALKETEPVICCPNRLYAGDFEILSYVSEIAFGAGTTPMRASEITAKGLAGEFDGDEVAVFGKGWGGELPLPKAAAGKGSYYVDWILSRIDKKGKARELTALEVQTIDTTGNYNDQAQAYFQGHVFTDALGRTPGYSNSGFNWENVNKRILPQVIYKGHVLRRESKCTKGMFFACPKQVYDKIIDRLGGAGSMHDYDPAAGTITFLSYSIGPVRPAGSRRKLVASGRFTTTIDQVALAFTSPKNLPPAKVYEAAINKSLG